MVDNNISLFKSGAFLPLFSINTIVDTDLGVLNYIFKEFRNEEYFDLNVLDYMELINKVYYRQFENPLYVIMKNPDSDQDKKFLDECYEELLIEKEAEILSYSLSTQIMNIIEIYKNQGNIIPTIMYYTNAQADFISRTIQFNNLESISCEEAVSRANENFAQFYVKYIEELYVFSKVKDSTFYVATCGQNLSENRDDIKDSEILKTLVDNRNHINVIDLYRQDIIGKDIYKHGKQ